uniref:Uncharacterized protein n=1 Tax=Caenorhabditis japonica TaxID=281687 RepID=A0A8R1E091_CAEJA
MSQLITMTTTFFISFQSGDLSLQDVRKSDSGWYTCEAKNSVDPPEPSATHQPVQTVASGRNTTISCDVIANPDPTLYIWSKNGHYMATQSTSEVKIVNAKPGDGGIYSCQADNIAGKGSIVETHLVIAEPPVFTVRPPHEIKVRQGDQASIQCQGFGDPMPIVYWRRNKKRINQATLNFKKIEHFDHGLYECVVSNTVETISTETVLLVESTKPQMATEIKFSCIDDTSVQVGWNPGYGGGYEQTFAVHAQNEMTGQWTTIRTSRNEAVLDHLEPFISYRVNIESVNQKGSTNSTTYNRRNNIDLPIFMFVGVFSLFFLFFCGLCAWKCFNRKKKKKNHKSRTSTPSKTYQDYGRFTYASGSGSSSSQPGTEMYYEPSIRLLDEANEWRGPSDLEPVSVRYPASSLMELDYDIGEENPIDDMFRDRYILGVQDPPAQLYQDLRLERLRREYKQSQI